MPIDLLNVEKPARYMGGEMGATTKPTASLRCALAFPDVYEVGMSHLGSRILYAIINGMPGIAAERVYAPWPDMEAQMLHSGTILSTLESSTPLSDCDIVGFTLQYELACTNILAMLQLGGIPLRASSRNVMHPIIIAGGPGAYNPEPLAPFFDAILLGDGEEAVVEIVEAVKKWKECGALNKEQLLEELSSIQGVYVPSFFQVRYNCQGEVQEIKAQRQGYTRVKRRYLHNLDTAPFPIDPIVPFMKAIHDRVAIEIARGCTRGCRFCQAGYIYRPLRERHPDTIKKLIKQSLVASGYDEISLLSLSTGDYSCIGDLLQSLMKEYEQSRVAVSLPSLRVGTLTEELIDEIKKVRKTGFTLAPEAATERMRQVINKGIAEEDLIENAFNVFKAGWRLIKLYFMMGLPTERLEDLAAIPDLASRVKRQAKAAGGSGEVNVAVSTFVPKPHTPFQWERQLSMAETKERQILLKETLRKKKLNFKYQDAALSFMEGVIARGDRRLADVIEAAVAMGARFDGWSEHFSLQRWLTAFADVQLDPEWYLRERRQEEILPWDHLDAGITREFLLKERQEAFAAAATIDCRDGACSACGVCDFSLVKNDTVPTGTLCEPVLDMAKTKGEQQRVRMRFSKTGVLRYLSHLELINFMTRAVQRAGVPVCYSNGFHPHPRFSFATATSVGVESYAEYMDIFVHAMPALEVMQRLNMTLPQGMEILAAYDIPLKADALAPAIVSTSYTIQIPGLDHHKFDGMVTSFLKLESHVLVRHKKGQEQHIDLRQELVHAYVDAEGLQLTIRRGKPLEYIQAITGLTGEALHAGTILKKNVQFSDTSEGW